MMTTASSTACGVTPAVTWRRSAAGSMLVAAAVPALAVAACCAVVAALTVGAPGALGALVGAGLVVVFCGLSLLALGATKRVDPAVVMLLALALYTAKVVALAVGIVLLARTGWLDGPLDRTSLGVTVVLATLTWTVGEIVAAVRHRQPLYDLERKS